MGDLTVKSNVAKRIGSGKPLSQFMAPKRPEITRLCLVDDRLSIDKTVSDDSNETPEKPKRQLKRPLPDDDNLRSLGSYNKPIPKKSKEVDRLLQQHDLELKILRNELNNVGSHMTP
jgi:hypothetical protein